MKQRLKRIVLLAIVIVLAVLGVKQIIKGIQEAVAYYERHDKYVTVEGEVRNVYRFGLGYTASISYDYKGGHSTYLEKRIGIAPKEGDIVKLQVDSFYTARVRPSSNGILRILFGIMILVAMGYFIYGYKNHKYDGISINISPKVKKGIRIASIILAAWIVANGVDVLVSSFFDARDFDWGLKMTVSDVSSKGLILCYRKQVATYIRVHKKKLLWTGIVTLLLGVLWSVFLYYDGERANKKFGLKVSLEKLTPKDATIVIECSDKIKNEELSVRIDGYRMEKWTPIGWREMQFLSGDAFYGRVLSSSCDIYPGNVCEQYIKWTGHYGVLGNGLYRIAMPIDGEYDAKEKTSETQGNCYATFVIQKGKYSDLEKIEPDKGPFNSEELIELQLKLEGIMCIGDKYPNSYAGCYTEKGNLIILLTTRSNKVKREMKKVLEQEEGIIFRRVKYSLNELREVQEKIGEIYTKAHNEGDEETIQLLSNLSSAGVREKENKVVVALRDMSEETVKAFKKLFRNGGKIRYEYGNVVDTEGQN